MRLLLIRHGQTPSNVLGRLDTARPGAGLTDLGVEQAERIALTLDGRPLDAIVASPLLRTQQTAAPLAQVRGLVVPVLEGLQEIEAGSLEGHTDRDSARAYLETVFSWAEGDLGRAMPGGPDGHAFFGRFDQAIADIEAEGHDSVAVVSHGAAIRVWASTRAIGVEPTFGADHPLDNTAMVDLDGSSASGWTLLTWDGRPADAQGTAGDERVSEGQGDPSGADPTGETITEVQSAR
jgi:broad specificity phosphatase PhoE